MAIVRLLLLALCFGVAVSAEDEPVDDCIVDNEDVLNDAIFGMIYKAESEEEKEALGRFGMCAQQACRSGSPHLFLTLAPAHMHPSPQCNDSARCIHRTRSKFQSASCWCDTSTRV